MNIIQNYREMIALEFYFATTVQLLLFSNTKLYYDVH